jgi:hypothetical protein
MMSRYGTKPTMDKKTRLEYVDVYILASPPWVSL